MTLKGRNTITLNQASMMQIIQDWLHVSPMDHGRVINVTARTERVHVKLYDVEIEHDVPADDEEQDND